MIFSYVLPTSGQKLLAPIDIALIWGSTDTLPTGQYSAPLDTALSTTGQKNIIVPFEARNLKDNSKITILVKELATTKNFKWDPQEDIVFITPPPYQANPFNTHAQINSIVPGGNVIMPNIGDTNFVLTKRPITPADTFYFATNKAYIIADVKNENFLLQNFELFQNYPNPFNPVTTIKFMIPTTHNGLVALKVYDILGRKIATLLNKEMTPGIHSLSFNSQQYNMASGVYFFRLQAGGFTSTKKMVLLR